MTFEDNDINGLQLYIGTRIPMPRYYKHHPRGYDLDRELPFCDVPEVGRVQLGGAGSYILICPVCHEEHYRGELASWCFQGHGPMLPLTFALADHLRATQEARGVRFTTVEYRRSKRLEREAERPSDWVFGTQTEADYPNGYCKEI